MPPATMELSPTSKKLAAIGLTGLDAIVAPAYEWKSEEQIATEAKTAQKKGRLGRLVFKFKTTDVLNENRRIYPHGIYAAALERLTADVKKGVIYGQVDHPPEWGDSWRTVRISEASHRISNVALDASGTITVECDVMNNEHGEQIVSALECGGNVSLSQRAAANWRDIDSDERARFKVPEGEYAVVAEAMRIYTYDIVANGGFADANQPAVFEHKDEKDHPMTLDELKKNHAAAVTALTAEITASVRAGMANEVKALVEEGVKAKLGDVQKALLPALESVGVVIKPIPESEAAVKLVSVAAEVASLKTQVASLNAEKERIAGEKAALESKQAEIAATKLANECFQTVHAKHGKHPKIIQILESVEKAKCASPQAALEHADSLVALIGEVKPEQTANEAAKFRTFGDLKIPIQDPASGSGGSGGSGAGANANNGGGSNANEAKKGLDATTILAGLD